MDFMIKWNILAIISFLKIKQMFEKNLFRLKNDYDQNKFIIMKMFWYYTFPKTYGPKENFWMFYFKT